MTDLEQMRAMLDRAGIPYEEIAKTGEFEGQGLVALYVNSGRGLSASDPEQPHTGGYTGFYSDLVFAADGSLYAVWAWE